MEHVQITSYHVGQDAAAAALRYAQAWAGRVLGAQRGCRSVLVIQTGPDTLEVVTTWASAAQAGAVSDATEAAGLFGGLAELGEARGGSLAFSRLAPRDDAFNWYVGPPE